MDPEQFRRAREAGGLRWEVNAEELEGQIKNLIVAERTSSSYEQEMRALLL